MSSIIYKIISFLNLDLIPNLSQSIKNGIKYEIVDSVLHLSGTISPIMENETIVLQIMNVKGRILCEISILILPKEAEHSPLVDKRDEVL